ncbi:hypothetical protein F4818DRAFT_408959 [Hypoxylon cercidicola]|nr:hypothetical protein F4818DRAFT_408959 [Hypoxylon cercidicola]
MTPQTRSRGKPSASASTSASVPVSVPEPKSKPAKVYKSTAAAPKQKVFPARKRQLRTYGSRNRKVLKDSQQKTLTQAGFVTRSPREVQEAGELMVSEEEDENEDHVKEPEAPAPVKQTNSKKRSRASRRKTTGDELVAEEKPKNAKRRRTLGDAPVSDSQQTITQMVPRKGNNDDEMWQISDSEGEDDAGLVMETPNKPKDDASKMEESKPEPQAEVRSSLPSLIQSATPTNRTKTVIPSSTSPPTPMMLRLFDNNSPLKERSTNLEALSPVIKKVKTPRQKEIPNSYSTTHSLPTTPTPKAVQKKAHFDIPEENKENFTPKRDKPKSPKPVRKTPARSPLKPLREVADTDDETVGDDDETVGDENEEIVNETAIVEDQDVPMDPQNDDIPSTDDPEPVETCYGAIGEETQAMINTSADELILELSTSDSRESTPSPGTPTPRQKEKRREVSRATVDPTTTTSPSNRVEESPSPQDPSDENIASTHSQVYTQALESQRLSLEAIRNLGPQTQHSDILLPLHPEPLEQILSRTKNHEFRSWKIPPGVHRVWIYATKPLQKLTYMFIVGGPKVPGEIEDEEGIGNAEFNQGEKTQYAYEILQVYELNNPVSLNEMKQKGWCKTAPQKFSWLLPAVVGELTANLKCALFGDEATESQEIMAQFQDDVEYSTQHPSSEHVDEVIPSSQSPRRPAGKEAQPRVSNSFAKPAVPQPQLPAPSVQPLPAAAPTSQRTRSFVRPSQATTVSSPAVSPQKSLRAAVLLSSDAGNPHSSSPVLYRNARDNGSSSLRSSQFLSRSQMLPDSLVNDEIQEPPPIIWDSADEQSD